MPAMNTNRYTVAKTISEVSTLPASIAVAASRRAQQAVDDVRLAPDLGRVPAGEHGDEARRRHQHPGAQHELATRTAGRAATASADQRRAAASATPMPTITRNAKNTGATGGRSLRRALPSGLRSRRRSSCVRIRLPSFGTLDLVAIASRALRPATRTAPAARRAAVSQCAFDRGELHRLVLAHVQPVQVADDDLQRHRDRGERRSPSLSISCAASR